MATARRYAEGTTVAAETTQAEIRKLLARYDCDGFGIFESRTGAHIQFELTGRRYQFGVVRPGQDDVDVVKGGSHLSWEDLATKALDAEWRRRWRARLLWLKATLEFAEGETGEEDLPTALAGYLVLRDGKTVGQAITNGSLPMLGAGRQS